MACQVRFQRAPILNKNRISKWGLYEPFRLENQAGEYCVHFQCLLVAIIANNLNSQNNQWTQLNRIKAVLTFFPNSFQTAHEY